MRTSWRSMGRRVLYYSSALAICGLGGGAIWWTSNHSTTLDLSANARHTLSAASVHAIAAVTQPLTVTAYLSSKSPARTQISDLVTLYQAHQPRLKLIFTDPASIADVARVEGIKDGELALELNGQRERFTRTTEEAFTNALLRLMRRDEQWLAFITGHGERSPQRSANFDVSHWAEVLRGRGYRVQELNLAEQGAIPSNTTLVVLASPQLDYLPGESRVIADYVAQGGQLLWLVEPDMPSSLNALAAIVGFKHLAATVIDPVTQALNIDNPALAVVTRYPEHPALDGLKAATLMPYATPLVAMPLPGWHATPLLLSSARAWAETGRMTGNVGFNPSVDTRGPLTLGLALSRPHGTGEQHLVVLGDGDFLSNTYIGNGGNQDLGTRLVDWLAANNHLISIETRLAPDVALDLTRWQQMVIGFGFLFVLPLAFLVNGALIWWRRHRA